MFNGLQQIRSDAHLVAVHDSARPLITPQDSAKCFTDAAAVGAAVLGVGHSEYGRLSVIPAYHVVDLHNCPRERAS